MSSLGCAFQTEGLWLAFATADTVGYGDVVPSTPASCGFAVVVLGMAVLGLAVLSRARASLAALFVEEDLAEEQDQLAQDLLRDINLLRKDIRVSRGEVQQLRAPLLGP